MRNFGTTVYLYAYIDAFRFCMLHVNTKTNNYHQSTIHVVCCIMFVYVKTVELLEKIKRYKKPTCHCPYKLRSYRLANNKIAREEKTMYKVTLLKSKRPITFK